jgi:hypothetical protein
VRGISTPREKVVAQPRGRSTFPYSEFSSITIPSPFHSGVHLSDLCMCAACFIHTTNSHSRKLVTVPFTTT